MLIRKPGPVKAHSFLKLKPGCNGVAGHSGMGQVLWGLVVPIQNWWLSVVLLVAYFCGALHCHVGTCAWKAFLSPPTPFPCPSPLGWTARPQ